MARAKWALDNRISHPLPGFQGRIPADELSKWALRSSEEPTAREWMPLHMWDDGVFSCVLYQNIDAASERAGEFMRLTLLPNGETDVESVCREAGHRLYHAST